MSLNPNNRKFFLNLSDFKKDILKLFTGTSISQLIPLISAPILTRIYSPEDFGIYATFFAISAILSIVASFRFELAIVIPEDNQTVSHLFYLIIILSSIYSFLILIAAFFFISVFGFSFQLNNWFYLIPVSVLVNSFYNASYYINIRNKRFKFIASIRILLSTMTLILNIILAFVIDNEAGLILSTLTSYFLCALILFFATFNNLLRFSYFKMIHTFKEFSNFPKYDIPSAFFIQLSNRLPVLVFSNFFSIQTAGFYALTQRMLDLPISFVTNAISDAFKQKAAEDINKIGNCIGVFEETKKLLIYLSIIPFIIIQFLSPQIFGLFFGLEWIRSGIYAQILAIMFLFRFIISPLTYVFYIRDKMRINMIGQFIKLLFIVVSLTFGIIFTNEMLSLIIFSFTNVLVYIIYYHLSLKYSKEI